MVKGSDAKPSVTAEGSSVTLPAIPGLSADNVLRIVSLVSGEPSCNPDDAQWVLSTIAFRHMTGTLSLFSNVHDINPVSVFLPYGGANLSASKEGTVHFPGLILHNVLYVPGLARNLISVGCLMDELNCNASFLSNKCVLQDRLSGSVVGIGEVRDGAYYYKPLTAAAISTVTAMAYATSEVSTYELWHQRLGHPSRQVLSLVPAVRNSGSDTLFKAKSCDACSRAKQTRSPLVPVSNSSVTSLFDMIHCEIWGPYSTSTLTGAHYFLTIVDDFSRSVWVHLMVDRSETITLVRDFVLFAKTQFGKPVKFIRSDDEAEFTSLKYFYAEHGIIHQTTCVDSSQQNGRVERKHGHVLEVARALRFEANLPVEFWGECVQTSAYLINRTPSTVFDGLTPHEKLFGAAPTYSELKVFGCLCFAHNKANESSSRRQFGIFMGYTHGEKGWRVYNLETKEYFVSREVTFHESVFPFLIAQEGSSTTTTTDTTV